VGTHPRERVRTVQVTTPPNTTAAAPQSTNWTVGNGVVDRVDVVIPPGHQALTGLQIQWGGRQVFPYDGAEFIVGDNDEITVALGLYVQAGILVVRTFNLDDTFAHSHLLRAYVVDLEQDAGLVLPLPPAPFAGGLPELPEAPEPEALFTPEEEVIVSTALDQFLADLDDILTNFLDTLQATLGVTPTPPATTEEPAPEAGGTVKVPNVVGMQQSPAADKLRAAGFTVTVRQKIDRSKPRFLIVDQAPNGGTQAAAGSDVTITSIRWS
jgi:hypothetical protein